MNRDETMRKLKLVAMDVDGTLMGKNKILTKRTKDTLTEAAAKGIHLVVASGRALQAVPEELIQIPGMEYVITSNGSSVFRLSDRKRIYGRDMTPEQIQKHFWNFMKIMIVRWKLLSAEFHIHQKHILIIRRILEQDPYL